ncbi:class I SAM-dependent methyltransferase [Litoribacillus peritrichatus]|uniref:Methyltransferase domain-containing protein n=1 Tax=Litoribacillus peritrichatus TaxID=718191 RepID=A0ABP7M0A3_9GAMM
MRDYYKWIGPVYDFLGRVYSGQQIEHCKVAMLEHLKPGEKVLFAGVGHGRDAIHAAKQGADVTVVDLSKTMLDNFQKLLDKENVSVNVRQVRSDIFKVDELEQYDMVVANFFLNVFSKPMMQDVLKHLITLCKPGGYVVVGDFIYPTGNIISRTLKKAYWYGAVVIFWAIANNALHEVYNYPEFMKEAGLEIEQKKRFSLWKFNAYWSVLGRKTA